MIDPSTPSLSESQLAFAMSRHHHHHHHSGSSVSRHLVRPPALEDPMGRNEEQMFSFDDDREHLHQTDAAERFLAAPLFTGDMDPQEPLTPFGSADTSASTGPTIKSSNGPSAGHGAAAARLPHSAPFYWDNNPDPAPSPPSLTTSPSPRVGSSYTRRQKDATFGGRPRNRQWDQGKHQESDQSPDEIHGLVARISDLSLHSDFQGQEHVEQRSHHHQHHHQRYNDDDDERQASSNMPRFGYEQETNLAKSRRRTSREAEDLLPPPPETPHRHYQEQQATLSPDIQSEHWQRKPSGTDSAHLRNPANKLPATGDDHDYYVIGPARDGESTFNGDEASLVTAKKLREQAFNAALENGKVVYMAGQATTQWWLSPSMAKRRRAVSKAVIDASVSAFSGAGSVIMTSTPVGRVYQSVSTNVNEFRAAPGRYALEGLGIVQRRARTSTEQAAPSVEGPGATAEALDDYEVVDFAKSSAQPAEEPVIAEDDDDDDLLDMTAMFGES